MTPPPVPTSDWPDMLRRLRARPASSWQHGDREYVARSVAQRLAELAAEASGEPRRDVPDVGVMALPDQLAVLMADAMQSGADVTTLTGMADDLTALLSLRS